MAQYGQTLPDIFLGNTYVNTSKSNNLPNSTDYYIQQINQSVPSAQVSFAKRRMLKWLVPERGIVEMYINPQSIDISNAKLIKPERTKGGYVIQYWGEELTSIDINGHTGSSGIEGINILNDIYRGEQIAFDFIALEELTKYQETDDDFMNMLLPQVGTFMDMLSGLEDGPKNTVLAIPKPTLGYYAATIEMYWMGEVYRGFFTKFTVKESAEQLGVFNYTLSFTATQKRGMRRNYLPWHHVATAGPSDHESIPYTYDAKTVPVNSTNTMKELQRAKALSDALRLQR
jgi:hypothetical protein